MKTTEEKSVPFSNDILVLLAGIAWAGVGIMLLTFAFSWLARIPKVNIGLFAGAGFALGLLVHHLGFLKIVDKNLDRIRSMNKKHPLFSFIPWKSYLIIGLMIAMGSILRHSSIPKQYLSVAYICMGMALILSSVRYFRIYFRGLT